jgi:hypothetical protein
VKEFIQKVKQVELQAANRIVMWISTESPCF